MASSQPETAKFSGMSVLISGAGVAGLMAALELQRIGCKVQVFERNKINIAAGDSFSIGEPAINAFDKWPEMQERQKEIAYYPLIAFHDLDGTRMSGPLSFRDLANKSGAPPEEVKELARHSRPKFHAMFVEQIEKSGITINYGSPVVDYFEDERNHQAGIVLQDGSRHQADLVIAADGLRGASWQAVQGHPVPARSSGAAVWRVAYPVELIESDPELSERFKLEADGRSVGELWSGEDMQCFFWRNQHQMTWVLSRPDHGSAQESWSHHVEVAEVLEYTSKIASWPAYADKVIKLTPPGMIIDWKLMWRDPQPQSASKSGRIIQMGDAAHTFLPSSGNGGTQAIEDAVSFAACLQMAGSNEKLPDAAHVHEVLRFERVSCLQAFGVVNRQLWSTSKKDDKGQKKYPSFGRWIWDHDPAAYARDNYDAALAHVKDGKPFKNTNTPPGVVYRPWTIEGLLDAHERGERTILDGEWD